MKKLNRTWFIDLDGTIVVHNGYMNGGDVLIQESKDFIDGLDKSDTIIITTGRSLQLKASTELFLDKCGVRYDQIIYDLPLGERIVINDEKPSGMKTAFSYNLKRNVGIDIIHKNESDEASND